MRFTFYIFALLSQLSFIKSACAAVQEGDLIFQTSNSSQSIAVQEATQSPYSHMGVVFFRNGQPFVYEASSIVKYTPLSSWIASGKQGHYVLKRLKNAHLILNPAAISKLKNEAKYFVNRKYDLTFEWSDKRIYCSELVYKLYDRALNIQIGQLQQLKEFNLISPAVKAKLIERYGSNIPMNEQVISPMSMFESELLTTVESK